MNDELTIEAIAKAEERMNRLAGILNSDVADVTYEALLEAETELIRLKMQKSEDKDLTYYR